MTKNLAKRYTFSLIGINMDKINEKYGLVTYLQNKNDTEVIPINTTKIDELTSDKKVPDIISFLDESKRVRKCTISMIDFNSGKNIESDYIKKSHYKCFWDKNIIPKNVQAIGCPIKYVPDKISKTYHSEISKEKYTINEYISHDKISYLENNNDSRIKIERKNYYLTDGIFCSFNCCIAYIQCVENKNNPLYRFSESLLIKMYSDINPDENNIEIIPAPHWRLLSDFGGSLSIEDFRESFNKIKFNEHGIHCVSIGYLYEDQLKF